MPEPHLDHEARKHPGRGPKEKDLAVKLVGAAVALVDPKGNGLNLDQAGGAVPRLYDTMLAHVITEEPGPTQKRRLHPVQEGDDIS